MELIIEEISRNNKLIGRHKFANSQLGIGRGYNNDLILTDPHICPDHLRISFEDGQWIINDLDSVNGSLLGQKKALPVNHVLQSGDIISLGKSQLRFLLPDHPVAPSIKFSVFESLVNLSRSPLLLMLNLVLFTVLAGLAFYLNATAEIVVSKLLLSSIGMTLLFAILPSLFTLISHLTKHEARFWTHIGVSFVLFNVFWLFDFIETVVNFNISSQWQSVGISSLISIVLLFALFWSNFFIGFHQSATRRFLLSAGFTCLITGTGYGLKLSAEPEFSARPSYDMTLLSPMFSWSSGTSVEHYIDNTQELFDAANKKKTEK